MRRRRDIPGKRVRAALALAVLLNEWCARPYWDFDPWDAYGIKP